MKIYPSTRNALKKTLGFFVSDFSSLAATASKLLTFIVLGVAMVNVLVAISVVAIAFVYIWFLEVHRRLNELEPVESLRLYDNINPLPYYPPWDEHARRLGVSGVNTLNLGIKLENTGTATIPSCSLRVVECGYRNPGYYGQPDEGWVADPVGTQELPLRPELPLPDHPDQSSIAHGGGMAIFSLAERPATPSAPGFHYTFSRDKESSYRTMDGLYCATIQLEGRVRQGNIETELAPRRFVVVFRHHSQNITDLQINDYPLQDEKTMTKKQEGNKKGSKKKESPLTREGFFKILRKISRPKDAKSSEEKSKTSE